MERDQGEEAKVLVVFTTATTISATTTITSTTSIAAIMTAVMMRLHGHVLVLHLVNGNGQWDAVLKENISNVSNHRNHLQRQRSWASTHGSGRINFLGRLRRARASSAISRFDLPPSTVGAEKMRAMQTTVSQRKTRRRLMVGSYLAGSTSKSKDTHDQNGHSIEHLKRRRRRKTTVSAIAAPLYIARFIS